VYNLIVTIKDVAENGGKAMRKKCEQMSLLDTYKSVEERLKNNKPELFRLLDEHLDWDEIIPNAFYNAFYQRLGRNRDYELEIFMRALFLQRIFHYIRWESRTAKLPMSLPQKPICSLPVSFSFFVSSWHTNCMMSNSPVVHAD